MRKIFLLITLAFGLANAASALTYEEAFDAIKAIPNMKGVHGSLVSGNNDLGDIGITDGQTIVWYGETGAGHETEVYGNALYKIMGELPASEIIKGMMNDQTIFVIFARPVGKDSNRILILSDSAGAGFTGALIGNIRDADLAQLRKAILIPRETGGTALYLNAMNF